MTTIFTQGIQPKEWLVSDHGTYSYDAVTVTVVGAVGLPSGQVLGKITATGKWLAHNAAAVDGSQVAAGILCAAVPAVNGDYSAVAVKRIAEVWGVKLNAGVAPAAAAIASLASAGIIVR